MAVYTTTAASPLAITTLSLDAANNPTVSYDFMGRDHDRSFDGANRLVQALDCQPSCPVAGSAVITTTPGYDPDGNTLVLTRTSGPGGSAVTTATYNAADWLLSQDDGQGPTLYGYDGAGRLRTQSLLGGQGVLTATLNAEGLTTALSESVGGASPIAVTSLFTYSAADLPLTATLPGGAGGVLETRGYDADSRLISLQVTDASTTRTYCYGYDPQGQHRQRDDHRGRGAAQLRRAGPAGRPRAQWPRGACPTTCTQPTTRST